jgi:hypothetical protein
MTDTKKYQQTLENIQATIVGLTYLQSLTSQVIKQLPAGVSFTVLSDLQEEWGIVSDLREQAERTREDIFSMFQRKEAFSVSTQSVSDHVQSSLKELQAASGRLWRLISEMFSAYQQHIIICDVEKDLLLGGLLTPFSAFVDEDYSACGSLSLPERITKPLYNKEIK